MSAQAAGADVSVVIATAAQAARAGSLRRAIDGIVGQAGVRARPIVVVNGSRFDPALRDALRADPRLRYAYNQPGSATAAQLAGRRLVETPYFTFLDDDDELLPGALARRKAELERHPEAAVVIENGYRCRDGVDAPVLAEVAVLNARDPAESLLEVNWMANGAALFRTDAVPVRFFEEPSAYMEWTFLALRLALEVRFRFLDSYGYRVHFTPGSLSRGLDYTDGTIDAYTRMLALPLPPRIAAIVRRKRTDALHFRAVLAQRAGHTAEAWRFHGRSLGSPYGLRYLSFTRRLLAGYQ